MHREEGGRFVAAASAFIGLPAGGVGEALTRGGMFGDRAQEGTDDRGQWDVAFVSQVGYWALFDHTRRASAWPLPLGAVHQVLADFAAAKGIVTGEARPGDVVLLRSPATGGFIRAAVIADVDQAPGGEAGAAAAPRVPCVLSAEPRWCTTIEVGVADTGAGGGSVVRRVARRLTSRDVVIRWSSLLSDSAVAASDIQPIRRAA